MLDKNNPSHTITATYERNNSAQSPTGNIVLQVINPGSKNYTIDIVDAYKMNNQIKAIVPGENRILINLKIKLWLV